MTLFCDCHFRSGPINVVKQCEWNYWKGHVCPAGKTVSDENSDFDDYPMANDFYAYTAYVDEVYPEIAEGEISLNESKQKKKSGKSDKLKKPKGPARRYNQIEASSLFAELPQEVRLDDLRNYILNRNAVIIT